MNNDENKIEGIGEIINQTASEVYKTVGSGRRPLKFNTIFSDRNYTRYIYIGNTRYASREELERNHTPDAQYINKQLEGLLPPTANYTTTAPHTPSRGGGHPLERLLFKGARHMKRGSGITRCLFMK